MDKTFSIYEMWNPFTLECFYVGKTNSKSYRFAQHIREAKSFKAGKKVSNRLKCSTICKIIDMGAQPIYFEIETFQNENNAFEKEKELIKYYGRLCKKNGTLTNFSVGGQGNVGNKNFENLIPYERTPEIRRKMSESKIGKPRSLDSIEKQRSKMLGRSWTAEQTIKQSVSKKGKSWTEAQRKAKEDFVKSHPNRKISPWTEERREKHADGIAKMAAKKKGKPWTEAQRKSREQYYTKRKSNPSTQ